MEPKEIGKRFEQRKRRVLKELDEFESEIKILEGRIKEAKQIVKGFKADKEAKKWCDDFDLEAGLRRIKLY